MDIFEARGSDLFDPENCVKIYLLPANGTSIHHPLEMGVISFWNKFYRRNFLLEIIQGIETREERNESNSQKPSGMNGTKEGYDPHILKVVSFLHLSWNQVSEDTSARCWIKSRILPDAYNSGLRIKSRNTTPVSKSEEVEVIVSAFKNFIFDA